jgi:hypothetical protein
MAKTKYSSIQYYIHTIICGTMSKNILKTIINHNKISANNYMVLCKFDNNRQWTEWGKGLHKFTITSMVLCKLLLPSTKRGTSSWCITNLLVEHSIVHAESRNPCLDEIRAIREWHPDYWQVIAYFEVKQAMNEVDEQHVKIDRFKLHDGIFSI